ncbi:MAG: hypothetical protein V4819_11090 [Verrucomicrobiota bacterium]
MKTISLQLIVLCGSLLSATFAQAGGPASGSFGGFTAGKKFTFTVQQVKSNQTTGTRVKTNVPIPSGIPKFTKGQKVTFRIGSNGQLTGPGFSIAFLNSSTNANLYAKLPNSKTVSPNAASVFKDGSGKPVATTMTFYQYRISNYTPNGLSINLVGYVLK